MGKTKATRENLLTLIQLWALVNSPFTTKKLAEFLGTTPRNAREYVRILKERGLIEGTDNVYHLIRLDDRAGKIVVGIIDKVTKTSGFMKIAVFEYLKNLRERLNDVYDLLCEAQDYCYTEWGDVIEPDIAYRLNKALIILNEILHELRGD